MQSPGSWPYPARLIVLLLTVMATFGLGGCRESGEPPGPAIIRPDSQGEPRPLALGLGAVPSNRTREAYIDAFVTAGKYADLVLIQRAPPWAEFVPGGAVGKDTLGAAKLESELAKQYGLQVFYAIDPTDPTVQRARLADLPADFDAAKGFAEPEIRAAFVAYARFVAKNYEPAYLALGVEINMYAERQPGGFDAFVVAYREAYRAVKDVSPNTKVFPTFELEELLGIVGPAHPPRWNLLTTFDGAMDALAVTTYPFLAKLPSARELAPGYYTELRNHHKGDVIIAAAGYPSAQVDGTVIVGTEEDQLAYVDRLLTESAAAGISLVTWLAPLDPPVTVGGTGAFRDIGLRRADGSNKAAWTLWEEWARRPLQPR